MTNQIILASGSTIRKQILQNAGVVFSVSVPRIDEDAIRASLESEDATPRDIADTLAEMKARKIGEKDHGSLVIGCDQVLSFQRKVIGKPRDRSDAISQLKMLRGETHKLLSAVVIYHDAEPVWRFVGEVRLLMHDFSDDYLHDYAARNWDSILHSVGAYKIEEEGARLFARVTGDYFTVLGIPLIEVLSYLSQRGTLRS